MSQTVEQAAEKLNQRMDKLVRGTLIGMTSKIIERSPVDTGRFRANWQLSIGYPAVTEVSGTDKSGAKAKRNAAQTINSTKVGRIFYLTNNLPYAEMLEFGWSKQAPFGMVRRTLAEYRKIFERGGK